MAAAADYPWVMGCIVNRNFLFKYGLMGEILCDTSRMAVVEDCVIEWGTVLEFDPELMAVVYPRDWVPATNADFLLERTTILVHIDVLVATVRKVSLACCLSYFRRLLVVTSDTESVNQRQGNSNDTAVQETGSFRFNLPHFF
jgi:hypothetical protein